MFKAFIRYVLTLGVVLKTFILAPVQASARKMILLISRNSRVGTIVGDVPPERIPPGLPVIRAGEICRAKNISLPMVTLEDGNVSGYELMILGGLASSVQPSCIFEIGTFNGLTALAMAQNAPDSCKLFTLDLPPNHAGATKFSLAADEGKFTLGSGSGHLFQDGTRPREKAMITQLFGDSATFDFAPWAGAADLVFVDGSHAFDYVLADSMSAKQLLRNGKGVIAWHDYGSRFFPDVHQALDKLQREDPWFRGIRWIANSSLAVLDRRA